MKTMQEIYNELKSKFFNKTSIDIERGTAIDYYILATSDMISEAHKEIENNKTPHIYSGLEGEKLDNMAILVGLTRRPDESDRNFLYRILNWNVSNKASNLTSIETALMDMTYASNVTYVPHSLGCGTATAYIIPKSMDDEAKELAIEETKFRLQDVVSPSSYIEYVIPKISTVQIRVIIDTGSADTYKIMENIKDKIIKYVNGIGPGEYLEVGRLNEIGILESNVKYFAVSNLFVDGMEVGDIELLQKVDSKFIISNSDIMYLEVKRSDN